MARLSDLAGQFQQTGGLRQNFSYVATGTNDPISFDLAFTEGNEEVYLNGARLVEGGATGTDDYVADADAGKITLHNAMGIGDVIHLVGRSADTSVAQTRAMSETVSLISGQTTVNFANIETDPLQVFVTGPRVDNGQLSPTIDYSVTATKQIVLTTSYPEGTQLTGVQGNRIGYVDPTSMVVNDGTSSKNLGARFRDTMESVPFLQWSTGRRVLTIAQNSFIERFQTNGAGFDKKGPGETGFYPIINHLGILWQPDISGDRNYRVNTFSIDATGTILTIQAQDASNGNAAVLTYNMRVI